MWMTAIYFTLLNLMYDFALTFTTGNKCVIKNIYNISQLYISYKTA